MKGRIALIVLCFGLVAAFVKGQDGNTAGPEPVSNEFFAEKVYPILSEAQCRLCHTDNGVASGTRLQFPRQKASPDEIAAFGRRLASLVDRRYPERSLLFQKPTNRLQHTGGERIPQGSENEKILLAWVNRLARLPEGEAAEAGRKAPGTVEVAARPALMRRLTHSQYNNTARDLLGDQTRPANQFPPEDFIHGFKNQAEGQSIPPLLAEAYGQAAEKLARNAFRGGDYNNIIPCQPSSPNDAACRAKFVRHFGMRAFRRPLTDEEAANYEELFQQEAEAEQDFLKGAQIVVEAMLQSPNFLFHMTHGPDGPWYGYEIAARLSYFLWDTMPDEKLFQAARDGKLASPEQVEPVARRMLNDPRAKLALDEFLAQWMRFDRVLTALRDRRLFRGFSPELAAAMTEESRRLFNHLVWENKNFMEFFTAEYGFLSNELAELYEFPAPIEEFGLVQFPPGGNRAGVLGQPMFHTVTSKPSDTSPTERGLFIREHFLCQVVPPPPPGVNASLPPVTDEKPMTNRERLQIHLTNEGCASCHRLIDPIGFGFEQYDAIGRFREKQQVTIYPTRDEQMKKIKTEATEYILDIDTSAEVVGIPDSQFSTPKELGQILAKDPGCQKCIVKQLFRYAFGRQETAADQPVIERALRAFQDSQFRFQELIISLVTSRAFLGGAS